MDNSLKLIRAKEALQKAQAKVVRIEKALESGVNPYFYDKYSLSSAHEEVHNIESRIAGIQSKIAQEAESSKLRNIPAITEFLARWRQKTFDYYTDMLNKYYYEYVVAGDSKDAGKKFRELTKKLGVTKNEYGECVYGEYYDIREYIDVNIAESIKKLNVALDKEVINKYDTIIARTQKIVTKITNANLYIGINGEINGYIEGTTGACSVETISAGGYNIQRFHFRVLIRELDKVPTTQPVIAVDIPTDWTKLTIAELESAAAEQGLKVTHYKHPGIHRMRLVMLLKSRGA